MIDYAAAWERHGTLYRRDICLWASEQWLCRATGKLIELQPHQVSLLRRFFTRDDAGRFPYETIVWAEPKKSGKTELGGLVALWVALSEPGAPEVYMVANDREQSRARSYNCIRQVVQHNSVLSAELRVHRDRIELPGGGIIETVPIDYAGAAGANPTLSVWDELWAYQSERALRLWDELTPVPTRRNSLRFVVTYAGFKQESKLLWGLYAKTVMGGRRIDRDLEVYESKDGTTATFWSHTPRMPWQTPAYYKRQRAQLRPSAYARLHQNKWVSAESAFISPEQWDALPAASPVTGAPVYVGVDAAHKRDSTALVAVAYVRGRYVLVEHHIWTPKEGQPVVPEETVIPTLYALAARHRIRRIRADPSHFETAALTLRRAGLPIEEYAQTPANLTRMGSALYDAIIYRRLAVYPAPDLREHVLNAAATETATGWHLTKINAAYKIDGAIALALAVSAAQEHGPADARQGVGLWVIA